MGGNQQASYLETLCRQFYESTNAQERQEAEKQLVNLLEAADGVQKCWLMLEHSNYSNAIFVAATSLSKLIMKTTMNIPLEDRIELRSYLLNYLVAHVNLPEFVIECLCQTFARLTKLSWFDFRPGDAAGILAGRRQSGGDSNDSSSVSEAFVFRRSVDEIIKMVQDAASVGICSLGIHLLASLVVEMNDPAGMTSISRHRKVAASFRDAYLCEIFQLAVSLLQRVAISVKNLQISDDAQQAMVGKLLQLTLNSLTFDFIGTLTDDTSDDNVSIQVPTTWRVHLVETNIVDLFFTLCENLPPSSSSIALNCLVQLSSIRRTLFNNNERQLYLAKLAKGIRGILESPSGLSDRDNYHEFCRLVARLKSNYQLSELIRLDDYAKLMGLLCEFTVQSLQMYQFAANSIHYLLAFWQRMVSSVPYVKGSEPHQLEQFGPLVTKAYIESRMQMAASVVRDGLEDPLEDHSSLHQQMEQFSVVCRCKYEKTCQQIRDTFDQTAAQFQLASNANDRMEISVDEARLTWLTYVIGAAIAGRMAFASNSEQDHDEADGDLICRVVQLMQYTDRALPGRGLENLEYAYLWFLEQFRKIYLTDHMQKISKVYNKLATVLGLSDDAKVLAVYMRKIITNLKYWSSCEQIVYETLNLLNDLSIGYSAVKKLVALEETTFLLNNHTNEHFSFLGTQASLKAMKCRTTFYTALTRLLTVELTDEIDEFQRFMGPLTASFSELSKVFDNLPNGSLFAQENAKKAVIGLARDIRGIAFASNTKSNYLLLFDWIYPSVMALFERAVEVWYADADVSTPVLKMFAELCQNRSQRLAFDVNVPNAYLLFQVASKLICNYGSRILSLSDIPKDQLYRIRLKGTMICFNMLRGIFSGSYVNFGVFRLYGDRCLEDVLGTFIKLLLVIPQADLLAYSKLATNYYNLLESISQDHLSFVSHLEPPVFVYILQTLHEGLAALDSLTVTTCCQSMDGLISYLYKRLIRAEKGPGPRSHVGVPPEGDNIIKAFQLNQTVFQQLLSAMLQIVAFEECRNQWSVSRPLLGLILLQEAYYQNRLRVQLIASLPVSKQTEFAKCLDKLMDGIERNVSIKNKDKFTQNLSQFRRDVVDLLKGINSSQVIAAPPMDSIMIS